MKSIKKWQIINLLAPTTAAHFWHTTIITIIIKMTSNLSTANNNK
jgi:hypothetical protein